MNGKRTVVRTLFNCLSDGNCLQGGNIVRLWGDNPSYRFMSRRKKIFSCGHKGYGQVCHRCANQAGRDRILQHDRVREEKRQQKQEWDSTFAHDPINLKNLPTHVVVKARIIIAGLQSNKNYREYGGKRLRHNRCIISIPVTRNYRMICHDCGSLLVPHAVLSHEDYNVDKPGG